MTLQSDILIKMMFFKQNYIYIQDLVMIIKSQYNISEITNVLSEEELNTILSTDPVYLEDIAIARRLAKANNLEPEAMVNAVKYKILNDKEQFINISLNKALHEAYNFEFVYPDGFGDGCVRITDSDGNTFKVALILPKYLTNQLLNVIQPSTRLDYITVLNLYQQNKESIVVASSQDNINDVFDAFTMIAGCIKQGLNDQQILHVYIDHKKLYIERIIFLCKSLLEASYANTKAPKMKP